MSIPAGLRFKNTKPLGFSQEFRDYIVTPVQTYSSTFNVSDVVRLQFNLQDWYIDPYESFIEAVVALQDESVVPFGQGVPYDGTNKVQFNMMDGPSTSLINDFRLEVNSREIERIREYDQVGNLLTDLNLYPDAVDQKDYEGHFSIRGKQTYQGFQTAYEGIQPTTYINSPTQLVLTGSGMCNIPSFPQRYSVGYGTEPCLAFNNTSVMAPSASTGASTNLNSVRLSSLEYASKGAGSTGYTGPIGQVNTPVSFLASIADSNVGGGLYSQIYNPSQFLGMLSAGNSNFGINSTQGANFSNGASLAFADPGFLVCPESPKLSQIDGHNIFLTNLPTTKLIAGQSLNQIYSNSLKTMHSRAYMQIPLLSGVMGVLIPSDRWQLIPSSSLGNCNMEFRFNPNAFFSYNDQAPKWQVTKFQLKLRLYRFDPSLMSQLANQVNSGITLHSQTFSMGPLYNIQPNVSVTNNWQINNGIPSIKHLFFWFLSNDYETYNFCRKNFKLSQNLTSMQLKVGSTYIPQNPILGHAGNIIMNSQIPADNSVFLSELHASLNLLFDCKKHCNINKLNFAINERPYDPTFNKVLGCGNAFSFASAPNKYRMLLDSGFTLWNEVRCRGKAIYSFNLDADKRDDDTMTGMDTTKVRPIELILQSTEAIVSAIASTMYVMFLSDFIVVFKNGETTTEGQG